ncbi:hypothetical protein BH11MYX1_BH11MYX1_47970 [soil metagenome]
MKAPSIRFVEGLEVTRGRQRLRFSAWAPFPIAVLAAIAGVTAICDRAIYARETASWAAQGIGQDWINATVYAPVLFVTGVFAIRGSRTARLLVGGLLLYMSYSFAIYAVAVHFNALFLVYCAVFGASTFALIDLVSSLRAEHPERWYDARAPIRTVAGTLFGIAGTFAALWLAQVIPALAHGADPTGLAEVGLAVNPVHVLDLALVLPAMVVVGVALLRGQPHGQVLAPILLGFAIAMALAIGSMVATMVGRGVAVDRTPIIAMTIIATGCLAVLVALLRRLRRQPLSTASLERTPTATN